MIYFGKSYTATVSGSIWKEVTCEGCQGEFVYYMTREARGSGSSPYYLDNDGAATRAQTAAVNALQKALAHDCDVIACPDCGQYQSNMMRKLRRKRFGWLHVCGWVGIVAALLFAWISSISQVRRQARSFSGELLSLPWAAVFGAGVGLIVVSWIGRSFYDPNSNAFERKESPERTDAGPFRRAEFEVLIQAARQQQAAEIERAGAGRRVLCPHCDQTFATTSRDRCPLCHGDWTSAPPQEVI